MISSDRLGMIWFNAFVLWVKDERNRSIKTFLSSGARDLTNLFNRPVDVSSWASLQKSNFFESRNAENSGLFTVLLTPSESSPPGPDVAKVPSFALSSPISFLLDWLEGRFSSSPELSLTDSFPSELSAERPPRPPNWLLMIAARFSGSTSFISPKGRPKGLMVPSITPRTKCHQKRDSWKSSMLAPVSIRPSWA